MKKSIGLLALLALSGAAFAQVSVVSTDDFDSEPNGIFGGTWLEDSSGDGFLVEANPDGGKMCTFDTAPAAGGNWLWKDITTNGADTAFVASVIVKIDPDADTLQSRFGLDIYGATDATGATGFGRIGAILIGGDGKGYLYRDTLDVLPPEFNYANSEWHHLDILVDFAGQRVSGMINGTVLPVTLGFPTVAKNFYLDADIYSSAAGFNIGHWDDHSVVKANLAGGKTGVYGAANPQDWAKAVAGMGGKVIVRDSSGDEEAAITLDKHGYFTAVTSKTGACEVFAKVGSYLSKKIGDVTYSGTLRMQAFDMMAFDKSGDANGDDSVDLLDYFALSDSYNLVLGDSGYDAAADFNGDDSVDLLDYFILSDNYNLVGEASS